MTVSAAKKRWTDAEILALPKDGREREIVNGDLIVSPAGSEHGSITMRIGGLLLHHVLENNLGEVLDGQTGCRMASGDLFSPDFSFVTLDRWIAHRQKAETFFPGGPDLAGEVLSPDDTIGVIEEKIAQYFANGTRLAWVVHPRTKTVHVYHAPVADRILTIDDVLDGEAVVPGFRLPLKRVFPATKA